MRNSIFNHKRPSHLSLGRAAIGAGGLLVLTAVVLIPKGVAAEPTGAQRISERVAEGARLFSLGRFEEAATRWTAALDMTESSDGARPRITILARRAEAYQALGFGFKAADDLARALETAKSLKDDRLTATLQGSYGNALMLSGAPVRAEAELQASLKFATDTNDIRLRAATQNNLGNVLYLTGRLSEAENTFRNSHRLAEEAGMRGLAAKALLNAGRVAYDRDNLANAASLAARALNAFEALPNSHDKAAGLVGSGELLARLGATDSSTGDAPAALAYRALVRAQTVAAAIEDARTASQAFGELGALYEDRGRHPEALRLTRRALFQAQRINAPEILYRWHWQAGRLHQALGDTDAALRSYRSAVAALRSIRSEFLVKFNRSRSIFPGTVRPVFTELVDLLLRRAGDGGSESATQASLREAQQTMELLKTAELEDYYNDECVQSLQAKVRTIERLAKGTAALYPIILKDRTELLVTLADRMIRVAIPVDENSMIAAIREFREKLETRTTREFLLPAGQLYDWLIQPIEPALAAAEIETLVIVPSGALRTVPLSPLHDGERFLIQKYALSIAPGLSLLDPRPVRLEGSVPLLSGLTQPVQGFSALPHVDGELTRIREMFGGKLFKDQEFLTANIERELSAQPYAMVHFASHAQFSADSSQSFLVTFDGKLSMDGLEKFVKLSRFRDEPVELLTLSACETAAGDDRAALGLAGIAIKAGARSALASLWFVNDQSTSALISRFYAELKTGAETKAQSLRRAQLSMLEDARYRHPFYWSGFILIGNWL